MASLFNKISATAYAAIFGCLARLTPPQKAQIKLGPGARVLVFTCAGIGDTLTDSVVLKALRETYPDLFIGAVVHRRRRLLLEHNPYVNQVYSFQKGPLAFLKLLHALRAAGPWNAILQLRGNDPEPRCLSYLLNPNVTVSTPQMTRLSWLCGHNLPQADWDETHGVEQTLRLARYLGADTAEPHLVYAAQENEKAELEKKLKTLFEQENFAPERPRLILQLGGGRRASWRDWPVERYAEFLCLHKARIHDAEVFVLGGRDQRERATQLAYLLTQQGTALFYRDLVGKFSLQESAALLAGARVLISTDTGIMHLGFAVGTRVLALIHCNNPAHRVGPYGYGERHRVLQLARPVTYRRPADATMANLSAKQVFQALQEIWP